MLAETERTYYLKLKNCARITIRCRPQDMQTMFYNMNKRNILKVAFINSNGLLEDITKYIL